MQLSEECYYRISTKGIVINSDGKILLAKEDNGKWEMLGGGLHHGEDTKECLKREIYEETGLMVTSISEQPVYFLTCKRQDRETYIANIVFKIELESLDFTPSEECQELRFFSAEEMQQIELFPNVIQLREMLLKNQH